MASPAPFLGPEEQLNYIFDLTSVPEVTVTVASNDWNTLCYYYDYNRNYPMDVPCDFRFVKNSDVYSLTNVLIRLRGAGRPEGTNGTFHDPAHPAYNLFSFKVSFHKDDPNLRFLGQNSLVFRYFKNDPAYTRPIYVYDLLRRFGVSLSPRASYARVNVIIKEDVRTNYFGVYEMEETVDARFLKSRFPKNDGGFLWKCEQNPGSIADMRDISLDTRIGINIDNSNNPALGMMYSYDLKNRPEDFTNAARQQMADFIHNLNSKSGGDLSNWLEGALDVDSFLRLTAVFSLTGNASEFWIKADNYYAYFDQRNICHIIPYKTDKTLGYGKTGFDPGIRGVVYYGPTNGTRPLAEKVLSVPGYCSRYSNYLSQLIDPALGLFDYAASTNRIRAWQDLASPYVDNQVQSNSFIVDSPDLFSAYIFYRLYTGGDSGGPGEANYFKTRIKCAKQELGLQ